MVSARAVVQSRNVDWSHEFPCLPNECRDAFDEFDSGADISADDRRVIVREYGDLIARGFKSLLTETSNPSDLLYIVALLDDLLSSSEESVLAQFSTLASRGDDADFLRPLVRVLSRFFSLGDVKEKNEENSLIFAFALRVVCTVFCAKTAGTTGWEREEQDVVGVLVTLLNSRSVDSDELMHALQCTKTLLRLNEHCQNLFVENGGLQALTLLLQNECDHSAHIKRHQVVYLTGLCVWLLTFHPSLRAHEPEGVASALASHGLVATVVDCIAAGFREKTVRILLSVCHALHDKKLFSEMLIDAGLLDLLQGDAFRAKESTFSDVDLREMTQTLRESLQRNVKLLSTFERWSHELRLQKLKWGVCHTEQFWRQQHSHISLEEAVLGSTEQTAQSPLRKLVQLANESPDDITVAVACFDLGELARHKKDATARRIFEMVGAKATLMSLMSHASPEVQRQALLAVQKLLIDKWEFVAGTNTGDSDAVGSSPGKA
ncbi:MAG: hypothetical protein MHM6MM_003954 [Cercozoa sp. M6MM]